MSGKIKKEKSIVGRIDSMSQALVFILVLPIFISLVLMLVYSGRYHNAIKRMETITSLKTVVAVDIPESVWGIVSGRYTITESKVYGNIYSVYDTIGEISAKTDEKNRLSLIVAERTMQTLENYVDKIRSNIEEQRPVVENEEVLSEVRDVAKLVDSMLGDYIAQEIESTAKESAMLQILVLITAFAETVVVALAWLIRNRVMKSTSEFVMQPIDRIEEVAGKLAEGTLDARLPDTEVTELRNLTIQVNIMADRLEEMMEKSRLDERNLRKAELRTLQEQINPHFLYNTLDAIIWKAEAAEKEEVIALTNALSDFFRISLSSGADWIPVGQERKHIEGYLKIQQTRYRDIMRYEIDIPDEICGFYVLKLLLQPLVENALYHGIKIKRGGGVIKVKGRLVDDMLEFTVADTGTGMMADDLQLLKDRMKQGQPEVSEGTGGFGLVNVNLRIRLYYNQPQGLNIASGPGGTSISFKVPAKKREEIEQDEGLSG